MAKHDDFDDFFGDEDDTTPVVDTRADGRLLRVPLTRLAPNLVNPRQDFGTEDELIDFGKSLLRRQNQACPVVSRSAYLKLWPDDANATGDVDYVLVSGERRYRAATAVGMTTLDCVVNDDFATDRKTFMEAVVSENVDRQNFDPIEEAYAVQALVTEFGSNRAVAQHFERVDGWVTQRVLLTHLAREVQDLVRKKTIPLEAARSLGKQARDNEWSTVDQLAWWEEEQTRRAAASAARSAARKEARRRPSAGPPKVNTAQPSPSGAQPAPKRFTAVKPNADSSAGDQTTKASDGQASSSRPSVPRPTSSTASETAQAPQTTAPPSTGGPQEAEPQQIPPYDDGEAMALHLDSQMTDEAIQTMIDRLLSCRLRRSQKAS